MANAKRDQNYVTGMLATSETDFVVVASGMVPLVADPATGRLLVDAGSISLTPSGTQDVNITKVGGNAVTTTVPISLPADIAPATQNITVIDSGSSSAVGANNQTIIIGNPTAGSAASFSFSSIETIRVEVTGIWTGTIATETSIDGGTTWVNQGVHQGAYTTSTFTAGFVGGANVAGATNFRIRATAAITGTVVVKVIESVNTQSVYIANAAPSGTVISVLNSSSATLTSGSVYTGTGEDVTNFSEMRVSVFSDVASATDGLSLQQSSNGTNWDITDTYTVSLSAAGQGKTYVVPRQARFFRVVYTNGGTNQASFRLQTILNRTATAPSSQRATDAYTNETDLVQNQSFLMGYNGTTWDRIRTAGTGVVSTSAVLTAGSALVGKVGIDQTTPGTTNLVSLSAETTKVIGTVNQGTSPWVVGGDVAAGTTDSGNPVKVGGKYTSSPPTLTTGQRGDWLFGPQSQGVVSLLGSTGGTLVTGVGNNADGVAVSSAANRLQTASYMYVFNGTSMDRMSGDTTGINVKAIVGALPAGANAIGKLAANSGVTIGAVEIAATQTLATVTTLTGTTTLTPGIGATNLGKAEDAAHTTGDTGVFTLGVRNDTLASTTSTTADYSQFSVDTSGIVMTAGAPRALKTQQQTTITSSTAETTVLTAVASTFLDVYGVIVTNTSATVTKVTFKDSTAGTTRFILEVPATDTRGFMLPVDSAIPQASVNTNWTATCGTSVASVEVTLLAVKRV